MSQTPACPDVPDEMLDAAMHEWFGQDYEGGRLLGCSVHAQELAEEGLRNVLRIALADRASRALPSTALAARPEEGWKLVPAYATKEMEAAAREFVKPYHDIPDQTWSRSVPKDLFRLAWQAMLAAAPSTPPTAGNGHD